MLIQQYQPPILNISLHLGFTANNITTGVGGCVRTVCWDLFFVIKAVSSQLPHSKECKQYYPPMHLLFSHISLSIKSAEVLRALNKQKKGTFYTVSSRLSLYTFNFGVKWFYWAVLGMLQCIWDMGYCNSPAVLISAYFSAEQVLYSAVKAMNCNTSTHVSYSRS